MKVEKVSPTKWLIEMTDAEVAYYVNARIAMMIKMAELVDPLMIPQSHGLFLIGLVSALKTDKYAKELLGLREKEPLLVRILEVQSDNNSPTSIEPPDESTNFPA